MTAKRRRVANGAVEITQAEEQQAFVPELAASLIGACLEDDLEAATRLVEAGADAWVQEGDSGWTSLHAAAYVGNQDMVEMLLRRGNAVWNMVDVLGMTAADVAYSMNHAAVYAFLLGEGVRAEMLTAVIETDSDSAEEGRAKTTLDDNATFLSSKLAFTVDASGQEVCVDTEGQGVMMGWEKPIMHRTAELLTADSEVRRTANGEFNVLNVGFGLGIIDEALQRARPSKHLIIEPHPDVLAHARRKGWFGRDNVRFYEGTWQQYLEALEDEREEYVAWDSIYFDTYSEHYRDLHAFFDCLPNLLRGPDARFSFFHGLGATCRFFYDVYTAVAELHLQETGLRTEWHEVDAGLVEATWQGTEKRYWGDVGPYRMPVCALDF